jgi:hypothetical protein
VILCVKLPDFPVIVTVAVVVGAVLLAVNVNVLVAVAGFALNEAVTPLGSPDADKVTLPANPFCGVMVTVLVPLVPRAIVKLLGEAVSAKFGAAFTVNEIVALCVKLPDVPAIVTVTVPVVAVPLAVSVKVLAVVAGFTLNAAVTPLGSPDADKLTPPPKPFCGVTVILLVPLAPCVTLKLLGDAESAKLGAAFTVRKIEAGFVKLPDAPVIVTVTVPVVAVEVAVSVIVLVVFVGFVPNAAVTPLGSPDADKLTLPLNPLSGVTVIVLAPLVPCVIVKLFGEADSAKFGVCTDAGQLFTRLAAFTLPIPVAKSQPVVVP